VWDERAFFNGYSHTKTVSEVAHRKTERLADAAAQRRRGAMSEYSAGVRQKLGWLVWAIAYEAYCAVRYPAAAGGWSVRTARAITPRVRGTWPSSRQISTSRTRTATPTAPGDATTAADFPEDEDRENPTLEASGGWSA